MPFTSPLISGEDTTAKKLINKALTNFFTNANRLGEVFECQAVNYVMKNGLRAENIDFSLPGPTYFSRGADPINTDFRSIKASKLKNSVAALSIDAKACNGANEIDMILTAPNKIAFVECKSGGAASSASQTNSYIQCCITHLNSNVGDSAYFMHLYEDRANDDSSQYIYNVFCEIAINQIGNLAGVPQAFFLSLINNQLTTWSNANVDACINLYNGQNPGANLPSGDEEKRAKSLRTILRNVLRMDILSTAVPKASSNDVITQTAKNIKSEYDSSAHRIWNELYLAFTS